MIRSVIFLTLWLGMCLYLLMVGLFGAFYGEPLGFLFLALGITASIPFIKGYNYAKGGIL